MAKSSSSGMGSRTKTGARERSGRTTSKETGQVFDLVVPEVDVYDLTTGQWSVLKEDLPTPRAGNSTAAIGKDVVVAGGGTAGHIAALQAAREGVRTSTIEGLN